MFEGRQSCGAGAGVACAVPVLASAPVPVAAGAATVPSPAVVAPGNNGAAVVAVCAKALPVAGQRSVQASNRVAAFRDVGRRVAAPFTFIPLHPANLADAGSKLAGSFLSGLKNGRPMK